MCESQFAQDTLGAVIADFGPVLAVICTMALRFSSLLAIFASVLSIFLAAPAIAALKAAFSSSDD